MSEKNDSWRKENEHHLSGTRAPGSFISCPGSIFLLSDMSWVSYGSSSEIMSSYVIHHSSHSTAYPLIHRTILWQTQSRLLFYFLDEKIKIQRVKEFSKGLVFEPNSVFFLRMMLSLQCALLMWCHRVRKGEVSLPLLALSISMSPALFFLLVWFSIRLRWEERPDEKQTLKPICIH